MYDPAGVLAAVDRQAPLVLGLCALSLAGNLILWGINLGIGFRERLYTMPLPCVTFFLVHDATFVLFYPKWFHEYGHWFVELWWAGLCVTVALELAFLWLLLRYGRRELLPEVSQPTYVGLVLGALLLTACAWAALKSAMQDDLFLVIFGITIFWCGAFNLALMARRRSAAGQTIPAWCGYLMMPAFYWPATFLLDPWFRSPAWMALGAATIVLGIANLVAIRALTAADAIRVPRTAPAR